MVGFGNGGIRYRGKIIIKNSDYLSCYCLPYIILARARPSPITHHLYPFTNYQPTAEYPGSPGILSTFSMKRKRPAPLGVLEFTSALNGEDPHSILQKLRHFVKIVRFQRQVALGAIVDGPHNEDNDHGTDQDEEDASICSLFEENIMPIKRQKLNDDNTNTPAWQMDKNDYRVPFVGTSVAKGDVGSAVAGCWPTGFLEGEID